VNGRTYPGIRASGRLRHIYCTLDDSEWNELQRYHVMDRISKTQLCDKLLRGYMTACREHYAGLLGPD